MANLWFASALLDGGWAENVRFGIEAGHIVRIDAGTAALPDEEQHSLALPGMPNVHSHAFQRAMAGLTEHAGPGADSFWTWRNLMYRFVDSLGPDDIEAISAFAFAQMLEAGFTRVGEFHYLHHERDGTPYADIGELAVRICAAAHESGIGLTLLPVFYAHSNFGNTAPTQGQRRFITNLEQFAKLRDASARAAKALEGARVGVAPHSLRAVAPAELAALVSMAPSAPLHLHIAEQLKEVADCVAWCGSRPVDWLLDHAPVDGRWCLVHATHVNPEEVHRLAACGAVVGLCPITEANLGDGVFPAAEFLTAGGSFAVGSDSNVLISSAQELRTLEYTQRLAQRRRNVLANAVEHSSGRRLLGAAVAGGAQALGAGSARGLHVGAAADIVSLDTTDVAMTSRRGDALLDSWIFAARGSLIDCVWRQGRKVVSGGAHVRGQAITRRYREVLARLLARL